MWRNRFFGYSRLQKSCHKNHPSFFFLTKFWHLSPQSVLCKCILQCPHVYIWWTIITFSWFKSFVLLFLPRDAMLARVIVIATCLSVCPSVRHAPVLCQNEESYRAWFLHHLVVPRLSFSDAKFHHQILRDSPRTRASKKGRSEKFSDFFSFKRQYLENGSRYGQSSN